MSIFSWTNTLAISVLVFIVVAHGASSNSPTCIDEDGNSVDWFIVYKFPELSEQAEPFSSGYAYAYITSESVNPRQSAWRPKTSRELSFSNRIRSFLRTIGLQRPLTEPSTNKNQTHSDSTANQQDRAAKEEFYWTISGKLLTDPKSIILRTLAIAYGHQPDKINSIFYNDAPSDLSTANGGSSRKSSSQRAHAKGAIVMDDITGDSIWLTHSTPQFPPPRSMSLEFHENSKKFGQTFMCIKYDLRETGKQIVNHLINMNPLVYDSQISQRLYSLIPDLHNLQLEKSRNTRRRKKATTKLAQVISTEGGQNLYIYSKSAEFGEDLYSDWMDTELNTTLYVETWRNGAGTPLNSSCPQNNYRVNNIKDLKVNESGKKITWSYHQDHSKWAISEDRDTALVCISDINRMQSQFKRGGGAVCIKCPSCWSVFSNTILDLEPCPIKRHPKLTGTNREI